MKKKRASKKRINKEILQQVMKERIVIHPRVTFQDQDWPGTDSTAAERVFATTAIRERVTSMITDLMFSEFDVTDVLSILERAHNDITAVGNGISLDGQMRALLREIQ